MRFWDTSALVPLLVEEPLTRAMDGLYREDAEVVVWWGTILECVSTVSRRERDGSLAKDAGRAALDVLGEFQRRWNEVQPSAEVRSLVRRLLRVHPLRAGNGLHLAAAVKASADRPDSLDFVCLDEQLRLAASREGFRVLGAGGA